MSTRRGISTQYRRLRPRHRRLRSDRAPVAADLRGPVPLRSTSSSPSSTAPGTSSGPGRWVGRVLTRATDVAVDDRGNVYTTGVVDRFLGPFDIFVAKYKGQVQHRATSCDQRRWHRTRDPATNSQHRFAALDHQRIRAEFLHRHDSLPQPRQSRRTRHHPRRHLSDDERRSATDLCHHAGTDQRPGFGGQDVGTRQLYCRHQLRNGGGNQQHSADDRIGQGGVSDASGTYQRRGDGHYRRSDTWLLPIPSAGQRRANRGAVSTPTQSP